MVSCRPGKPFFLHVFPSLWLCWTTSIHVKATNNTLKPGWTLDAESKLCSENEKYCMSFGPVSTFTPTYLRIYASKDDSWIVWVYDRNQPIFNDSGVLLSLDNSGVLKIETQDGKLIILHSPLQAISNTVAILMDTGNFVLEQLHPNGSRKSVLWQSFDYPTDTLVPEMKLGVNHKTGHNWSLVSYLSTEITSFGAFRLEWEFLTQELIIRRQGQLCWKSGKIRNNRFEHISEEAQHTIEYTVVSDEGEDYITFNTRGEELTKWTLLETGQLISRKGNDIARADLCYGYNTDGGCQRWEEKPTCRQPGDVFEGRVGYYNDVQAIPQTNMSYGISDCKASCWSNCSCVGFISYYINGTGCIFFQWKSMEGVNFASGGNEFYMLVRKPQGKRAKKWIWISALIAAALLLVCSCILCLALKKIKFVLKAEKKRKRMETEILDLVTTDGSSSVKDLQDDLKKRHDLKVFSYASIMVATNEFSSENKLGHGGFGPVFKGILPTGQEVAVKRLSRTSGQGVFEFKNELRLIGGLQHTNLVQLRGYCIHEQERMLIYEYMPNKSLDFFLFDSTRSKLLDWSKRFSIIEGIAQGLLYLHKYSRLRIIHRDLKASNILLDANMNPKISDFGLARMFTQESEANTNRIVGTYGYMSPEYAMEGHFSIKSDVYSFGVLLLEIVSGRKNNSFCTVERPLNLVGHAWELWNQGVILQLMDPSLNESFAHDEVLRCFHVGLLCVEENADNRPTMSDIISMLTTKGAMSVFPKRPAFYVRRKISEEITSSKEFDMDSNNESSLSNLYSI